MRTPGVTRLPDEVELWRGPLNRPAIAPPGASACQGAGVPGGLSRAKVGGRASERPGLKLQSPAKEVAAPRQAAGACRGREVGRGL